MKYNNSPKDLFKVIEKLFSLRQSINCTTKVQKLIVFCTFVVQLMYLCA